MPTYTFNNTTADGAYDNALNWDSLALPDLTIDVVLAAIGTSGNVSCLNLTDSSGIGANYIGGGAITCYGTATHIQVNGGQLLGGTSSTLNAAACIFTTDPGAANYSTTGATQVNANIALSGSWTGDGNEVWGAVTITGGNLIAASMSGSAATIFSTNVICSNIQMENAVFNSGITQTGGGVNLTIGSLGGSCVVAWNSVTSLGVAGVTGTCIDYIYFQNGNTQIVFSLLGAPGNNLVLTLAAYPAAQFVQVGHTTNTVPGTLTLPAVAQVLTTGGSWGVAGNGSTGTATIPGVTFVASPATGGPATYGVGGTGSIGTLTLTAANNVIHGSGAFGIGGSSITPNWYRPGGASTDAAAAVNVDSLVTFGAGNAVPGTDIAQALATSVVKSGTAYGNGQTGTYGGGGGSSTTLIVAPGRRA